MITTTEKEEEKKEKLIAGFSTAAYVVIVILLLIFGGMKYLDPPPQTGLEINLGYSETGQGDTEELQPQENQNTPVPTDSEDQLTDEESPVKTEKTEKKEDKKQEKTEDKPKTDDRLKNAMKDAFKNKKHGGQGDDNKDGNKGSENGTPNGNDTNSGGGGSGIDFSLSGRSALSLPKPGYQSNEQGIVVVDIIVDRSGKVVSATAYGRGSTTNDAALHAQAKRAALKAKFSANPDGPEKQKGQIRYTFKLN